eukprot:TRINITY_DN21339_c0_g1_i1.p1 TRINITY_DN21339_c0_g1~~TRINITY_DN21339_c0_g1_i1.p1  ORF type:complete len:363 (+),score=135.05 TRINITY_DN21339_c0_g1_i1:63-1151(+)
MECRAVPELYEWLWKEKTPKQEEASKYGKLNICIPETVVYMFAKAQCWYYTGNNGRLKKRQHLNSQRILERLQPAECDIAAYSIPSIIDGDSNPEPGEVRYYDHDGLTETLTRDRLPDHAILQHFLEPKPAIVGQPKNRLIQSVWQPYHIMIIRRENSHLLNDRTYGIQERAETVEGLRHSSQAPLKSPMLMTYIKEMCNAIAEHLFYVADICARAMRINWKIDEKHNIRLLWCSELSVVHKNAAAPAPTLTMLPANPRLYLAHRRNLKRQQRLKEEKEAAEREVKVYTPPASSPVATRGAPVYRPPNSALLRDQQWGGSFPTVKRRLLTSLAEPLFAKSRRERDEEEGWERAQSHSRSAQS